MAITHLSDIERVRREARSLARRLGFGPADAERVILAVSELATNLLRYAQVGEITLRVNPGPRGVGIQVESQDAGPGIADVERALQDGYSTGGGLGSGLPRVRRLMDDFTIATSGQGTRITALAWPHS